MATAIQFRFPECQKVDLKSLIPRATEPGQQLLNEFLSWDSEKRPSAQQALKYPFFQIVKRGSDPNPIHVPSVLLAKHQHQQQQQQQQQIYGRNQGFHDDRVSHASLDETENYLKDTTINNRHFDQFNTFYRHLNGIKPAMTNDLTDAELSPKRNKPENGINSTLFNGDLNKYTTSLNNNYQSEVSMDDVASIDLNHKNPFTIDTSDTGFSSIVTARNSQNSSIVQPNHINDPNGMKSTYNFAKSNNDLHPQRKEIINGINQRRNSRTIIEQNPFLSEKISDIYVNRHIGKLYDNRGSSIYNNKVYNGGDENNMENNSTWQKDYLQKSNTFFLHENNSVNNYNENRDSKIYNIFSKQRIVKPIIVDQTNEDDEENGYLLVKMTSATKIPPKKSVAVMRDNQDAFEDKELDKLLG